MRDTGPHSRLNPGPDIPHVIMGSMRGAMRDARDLVRDDVFEAGFHTGAGSRTET